MEKLDVLIQLERIEKAIEKLQKLEIKHNINDELEKAMNFIINAQIKLEIEE